jgi:hypothetical protein
MFFKLKVSNSFTYFYIKTVIIIISGLFCFSHSYSQQPSKPYKHYIGKFICYVVQNNKPMFGKDGMDTVLIFDNYALETIYSLHMNSTTTISTTKERETIVKGVKRKFINYYLFDFNKGICMSLDSNQGSVHVRSSFPIAEKKDGLVLKPQIDENELSAFRFIKDTIVNHATYKLLEINYPGNPPENFIKKKTLWLNPQLKNFLFDPISKALDEKYDGTILSYIETKTDGKNTASGGVISMYKIGLEIREVQLVKKIISVANHVNAKVGN